MAKAHATPSQRWLLLGAAALVLGLAACETGAGHWESWEAAQAGLIGIDYTRLIDCAGPPVSEHATSGNSGNIQYVGQYSNDIATSTCRLSIDITGGRVTHIQEYVDINGQPTQSKSSRYSCTRIVQFCPAAAH
jgi:hypothetical protein